MIPTLLEAIPPHTRYVEVFGGSVELLLAKPRSHEEIYNDVNGYLVNLFMQVRDNPEKVQERLQWLPNSRDIYEKWARDFRNGVAPSDPIEQAARYYYVLCCQFAGRLYAGWAIGRVSWKPKRIQKLVKISSRLQDVLLECSDFRKVLETWDSGDCFMFLDPPYLETASYRQGFTKQDHMDLAERLRELKARWILTINDHYLVKKLYRGLNIRSYLTQLSSQKVEKNQHRGQLRNMIISNFKV
jgi:DNA adenine methylase